MLKELWVYQRITNKSLLTLIAGCLILVWGFFLSSIPTMIVSQGWPATEGVIISCIRQGTSFKEYDGDFHTETKVFINYRYSVKGIIYSSSTVNAIEYPLSLYPITFADRYPTGKAVVVYFNPENPAQAVLEPGFVLVTEAVNLYSFLVSTVGFYVVFRGFAGLRKDKKTLVVASFYL